MKAVLPALAAKTVLLLEVGQEVQVKVFPVRRRVTAGQAPPRTTNRPAAAAANQYQIPLVHPPTVDPNP